MGVARSFTDFTLNVKYKLYGKFGKMRITAHAKYTLFRKFIHFVGIGPISCVAANANEKSKNDRRF